MFRQITTIPDVFIAKTAYVCGDVEIGEESSVWFGAVIRGDQGPIRIGKRCNIQDNCVLHVDEAFEVTLGDDVTIGHGAIIHGCEIGSNTLIGMGAIVLNGAKIGRNCIIGAGALVTQNAVIPDNSLAMGVPAKVKRELTEEDRKLNQEDVKKYVELARLHAV